MLLGYGYMRNNLVYSGGYPTHWDVTDMSDLFYFYSVFICQGGRWAYQYLEAKWDEQRLL